MCMSLDWQSNPGMAVALKTTLAAQLCFQKRNLFGLCQGKQRYWHLWFCSYKCNYTWIFDSQRLRSWFMSVCCQQYIEESGLRDCSNSFLAVVHTKCVQQSVLLLPQLWVRNITVCKGSQEKLPCNSSWGEARMSEVVISAILLQLCEVTKKFLKSR